MGNILPDYGNIISGPWDKTEPMDSSVISSELASSSTAVNSMTTTASAIMCQLATATPNKIEDKQKTVQNDIENMTRTELGKKYDGEYSSWSNMKRRRKTHGRTIHPDFEDFRSFLSIVGPRPIGDYTLDRIDTLNPEYSPENCRWASKPLQTANRKNTVYLTSNAGVTKTLSEWSRDTGTSISTMHSRRGKDWVDHEVIYGRSSRKTTKSSTKGKTKRRHSDWTGIVSDPEQAERLYKRRGHGEYRQVFAVRMYLASMVMLKDYVIRRFDVQRDDVPIKYGNHMEEIRMHYAELMQRLSARYAPQVVSAIVHEALMINNRCN